jgi:hypothetical protein
VQIFWKIPSDLKSASPSGLFFTPIPTYFHGNFCLFFEELFLHLFKQK